MIHHEFDNSLHFNHKLNVAIRNINAAVKLIFKNTKDQYAITAITNNNGAYAYSSGHGPNIDDDRIKMIHKIANTMKVFIPKRFESKTALREFVQTREFITGMK